MNLKTIVNLVKFYRPEEQLWFSNWLNHYLTTGDSSYDNSTWVYDEDVPQGILYLMSMVVAHIKILNQ